METENLQVGQNIRLYRERMGYSQEHIAQFLGIPRVMISYFEHNQRAPSLRQLEQVADLFGINLIDLLEVDFNETKTNVAFAFRAEGLTAKDLKQIAHFKKIVKNYIRMDKLHTS